MSLKLMDTGTHHAIPSRMEWVGVKLISQPHGGGGSGEFDASWKWASSTLLRGQLKT